ncbi:hypothetical protein [Sphingomonas sp. TREG-RG-20F-R18-01]|uniref:hypothetical protein n=1 Tax=Sphingomonas sp. TREG-RG-20F-R18-01 TaxID=2914982 RepID=UPI001F575D82|nr:hypothetical protein [Sphingomonas sp. TREG-RG-20F-R18-01]
MLEGLDIGAVSVALIGGAVSLVGLIISKEQKTSEFRQAWVDALRSEITAYLTSFNAIADGLQVNYSSHADKVKAVGPLYSNFNAADFAITLGLNPNEDRSKDVISCMGRLKSLALDDSQMIGVNIRPIEIEFLRSSKELLKYEWNRVKKGEPIFSFAKYVAAIVVLASIVAILFGSYFKKPASDKPKLQPFSIQNKVTYNYGVGAIPSPPETNAQKDRRSLGSKVSKSRRSGTKRQRCECAPYDRPYNVIQR